MASMRGPIYNPAGGSCTTGLSACCDPGLRGCSSVYLLAAVVLYACSSTEAGYWQGYVEGEYVYVAAPLAGWLNERHVNRGRQVERGDVLFMLEQAPEIAARNEAEARLQRALASLEDLTKGKRPEEIAVIEQQLAQAQAALELSAIQLQRQRRLFASKVVPRGALDEAHTAVERDRARVRELQAELETARLAARNDEIRAAEAEVEAARAALAQADWALAQKTQRAPEAGLVEDTFYEQGEWIAAGRPVVSLLPPDHIRVRFFVPETELGTLRIGEEVRLRCDGCPGDLRATIGYISSTVEYTPPVIYSRETRAKLVYRVEARPAPANNYPLHPGQPVEVWPAE